MGKKTEKQSIDKFTIKQTNKAQKDGQTEICKETLRPEDDI